MPAPKTPATNKDFLIRERNIPELLKEFPHWLMWKYAPSKKPGAKPRKLPYYTNGHPRSGVLGSQEDVENLRRFDHALRTARDKGYDGIGLAILPEQDITVLDLDDCITDTGEYSEFAQQVINEGSYIERSPSGRGLRAVYRGALVENEKRNFHIDNGERVEIYCGRAYTTFTGNVVKEARGNDVDDLPRALRRRIVAGMQASGAGVESTASDDTSGLASMNAIALPNMSAAQALRVLKALPAQWGASGEGTWYKVAAALHMQFDGSEDGWEVLDEWSQDRDGYDREGNRARWDAGFSHNRGKQNVTSMRNLVFEARDAGAKFKSGTLASWGLARAAADRAAEDDIELPDDPLTEELLKAWTPLDISGWASDERPAGAPALVPDWLYEGSVTLFSSHGGGGKSYVSLTFAALAAVGGQWFGTPMQRGDVLYVNGEDPVVEVRHRLWGICRAYDIDMQGLQGHLDIVDVTGVLHKALYTAGTDFGKTEFTKQYRHLCDMMAAKQYKYLLLDNLSKFYMANENARPMVDEFISALAAIGTERGIGVLLIGHASKLGTDGYSGSTAWHNSARARWALNIKDGNRDLMVEKNNYGKTGHGGRFAWCTEAHILRMGQTVGEGTASSDFHDQVLLDGCRETVMELYMAGESTWVNARGSLGPIEQNPWALENGLSQKLLREVLHRCVEVGMLGTEEYHHKGRSRKALRFCPLESDLV